MVEHFKEIQPYVELYKSIVPVTIVTSASLIMACAGKHHRTVNTFLVLIKLVQLLCVPILLIVIEVNPNGVTENTMSSLAINYCLVILPLLLFSALHPILVSLSHFKLCSAAQLVGVDVEKTPDQDPAADEVEEEEYVFDESNVDLDAMPELHLPEMIQDALDNKIPSFFRKKVLRDEKKVDEYVQESQQRADERREEIVQVLEARNKEREYLVRQARDKLKKEGKLGRAAVAAGLAATANGGVPPTKAREDLNLELGRKVGEKKKKGEKKGEIEKTKEEKKERKKDRKGKEVPQGDDNVPPTYAQVEK
eukprot:sb/3467142/